MNMKQETENVNTGNRKQKTGQQENRKQKQNTDNKTNKNNNTVVVVLFLLYEKQKGMFFVKNKNIVVFCFFIKEIKYAFRLLCFLFLFTKCFLFFNKKQQQQ